MTTVSDEFDRAGPGLGTNWTTANAMTAPEIASSIKATASATGTHCVAYWNANTFENDQFAECTIVDFTSAAFLGPSVRHQAGATDSFYTTYAGTNGLVSLYKWVTGSANFLDQAVNTFAGGDVLRLEVAANVLTVKKNGTTVLTVTDTASPFTSGSPGLDIFEDGANKGSVDSWSAGPIVEDTPTTTITKMGAMVM